MFVKLVCVCSCHTLMNLCDLFEGLLNLDKMNWETNVYLDLYSIIYSCLKNMFTSLHHAVNQYQINMTTNWGSYFITCVLLNAINGSKLIDTKLWIRACVFCACLDHHHYDGCRETDKMMRRMLYRWRFSERFAHTGPEHLSPVLCRVQKCVCVFGISWKVTVIKVIHLNLGKEHKHKHVQTRTHTHTNKHTMIH